MSKQNWYVLRFENGDYATHAGDEAPTQESLSEELGWLQQPFTILAGPLFWMEADGFVTGYAQAKGRAESDQLERVSRLVKELETQYSNAFYMQNSDEPDMIDWGSAASRIAWLLEDFGVNAARRAELESDVMESDDYDDEADLRAAERGEREENYGQEDPRDMSMFDPNNPNPFNR